MSILDASATSPSEFVTTRFFTDVDGDLDGFATRYGTSAQALVTYADNRAPGRTTSDTVATQAAIERGDPFPLRVPPDEARFAWGTFTNDTGRQLTLAEVITQINGYPWPQLEPHASARQLWSYAMNAEFRGGALHGRSASAQRGFDDDPATAPVIAGAVVRFPLVRATAQTNVCAAHGCTSVAAPRPTWIGAHDAEFLAIEHFAARMLAYRGLLEQVQEHAVMQTARLDFIIEYLRRLAVDEQSAGHSNAGTLSLQQQFVDLKLAAHTAMVAPGPAAHRPMWLEMHRQFSRELAQRLSNPRFHGWHEQIHAHWQELGLDAHDYASLCAQAAMVAEELNYSDTAEVAALIQSITELFQGQTPSVESGLTTWVRHWGPLVSATLGDLPGPAGLAGAIMKVHLLRVVVRNHPTEFAVVREGWRGRLFSRFNGMPDPAQRRLFTEAMENSNTLARAPRMFSAFAVRGANSIAAAFAIYAFFITWNDTAARADFLSRATAERWVSVGQATAGLASGTLVLVRSPAELFSRGFQSSLDGFASSVGTKLTYILGALAFIQGGLQFIDGFQAGDALVMTTGALTCVGGLATVAGAALAIPGLELIGAALGTVAVLITVVQALGSAPACQQMLLEVLRNFAEAPIAIRAPQDEQVQLQGFQGRSLFSYVVQVEHRTALDTAYTAAHNALVSWSGARLDHTDDNVAWIHRNRLDELVQQLTQAPILRNPSLDHPGGTGQPVDAVIEPATR